MFLNLSLHCLAGNVSLFVRSLNHLQKTQFVNLCWTVEFFFFGHTACEILVPQLGIEPTPPAVEAWSLNQWTAREFPRVHSLLIGPHQPLKLSIIQCWIKWFLTWDDTREGNTWYSLEEIIILIIACYFEKESFIWWCKVKNK